MIDVLSDYDEAGNLTMAPFKNKAQMEKLKKAFILKRAGDVSIVDPSKRERVSNFTDFQSREIVRNSSISVSRYGSTNPSEDFAETFSAFLRKEIKDTALRERFNQIIVLNESEDDESDSTMSLSDMVGLVVENRNTVTGIIRV